MIKVKIKSNVLNGEVTFDSDKKALKYLESQAQRFRKSLTNKSFLNITIEKL